MFIHHSENLKEKTYWMVHAGKNELQVPHYVLTNTSLNVTALCTNSALQFVQPCQMKQERKRLLQN
jgi:hypothetical protein